MLWSYFLLVTSGIISAVLCVCMCVFVCVSVVLFFIVSNLICPQSVLQIGQWSYMNFNIMQDNLSIVTFLYIHTIHFTSRQIFPQMSDDICFLFHMATRYTLIFRNCKRSGLRRHNLPDMRNQPISPRKARQLLRATGKTSWAFCQRKVRWDEMR